jgi:hypothetical protein
VSAPAPAKESKVATSSLEERIRQRAYALYLQRGNQPGSDLNDWLQAEEDVRRAEERARDEKLMYLIGAFLPETTAMHWTPER